jgi:hypothetical protein
VILIVLVLYAAVLATDFRAVLRSKRPAVIWPYLALFVSGLVVQSLHVLNVPVPSPAAPISEFVSSIFNLR